MIIISRSSCSLLKLILIVHIKIEDSKRSDTGRGDLSYGQFAHIRGREIALGLYL